MAQGNQIHFGYSVQMDEQQCVNCGCPFAAPKVLIDSRRITKQSFYCPNGHGQSYTESEADRLRKQLATAQQRIAMESSSRQIAELEAQKARLKLKRVEKRIGNGTCPCCNRHFVNVERHMKTKHPDVALPGQEKAK